MGFRVPWGEMYRAVITQSCPIHEPAVKAGRAGTLRIKSLSGHARMTGTLDIYASSDDEYQTKKHNKLGPAGFQALTYLLPYQVVPRGLRDGCGMAGSRFQVGSGGGGSTGRSSVAWVTFER